MAETIKARSRREKEGFFAKYCKGKGIDIGCGDDKLTEDCDGWDLIDGDATHMLGVPDEKYDFVYSSHCLEHLEFPGVALRNWYRILKPGGYLIVYLPHRDLYEKKTELPSRYNPDHKHFYLIEKNEAPCTLGVLPLIADNLEDYEMIYVKKCDEGWTISDPLKHSNGEYSIEFVIRKPEKKSVNIIVPAQTEFDSSYVPYPTTLAIESTSKCDVMPPCVMCIRNLSKNGNDVEDFVLEKLTPYWKYLKHISFHGIGEVMYSSQLERLILMSKHAYSSFTTGGHLFTDENIKFIVDNDVDYISISIDAATKETHDKIRGTGFDKILAGIINLQKYKAKVGKNNPEITLNATLMRENVNEAADIVKLAYKLDAYNVVFGELAGGYNWKVEKNGFNFEYEKQRTVHAKNVYDFNIAKAKATALKLGISMEYQNIYDKSILMQPIDVDVSDCHKLVPATKHFPKNDKSHLQIQQKPWTPNGKLICSRPWQTLWVNWKGDVAMCCHQNKFIGSLREKDFEEIWRGEPANSIRQAILSSDLHSICKDSTNICRERFAAKINLPEEYND